MIDEVHRTQSLDFGDNLCEAFPNAARVAFTGTPLITERHGERQTYKLVHELCHMHHRDHSDAFRNEVDKVLPY